MVTDNTAPVITKAVDTTVECQADGSTLKTYEAWLKNNGGMTAWDVCDTDLVHTHDSTGLNKIGTDTTCNDAAATATFVATDRCDNSASTTAKFSVVDTLPPYMSSLGSSLLYFCDKRCPDGFSKDNQNALALFEQWVNVRRGCLSVQDCNMVNWSWEGTTALIGGTPSDNMVKPADFNSNNLCGTEGTIKFVATDSCGKESFRSLRYSFPIIEQPPPPPTRPPATIPPTLPPIPPMPTPAPTPPPVSTTTTTVTLPPAPVATETTTTQPPPLPPCQPQRVDVCGGLNRGMGGKQSKPSTIEYEYIGGNTLSNSQDGKASVSGNSGGVASSIFGSGVSQTNVAIGRRFTQRVSAAASSITIQSAGGTQRLEIHTSCSKSLMTGDIFGGLKVVGFNGRNFGCNRRRSRRQYEAVPAPGCCYGIAKMQSGPVFSNFQDITDGQCAFSTSFPEDNAPINVVYTIFEQGQTCSDVKASRVAASQQGCCYRFRLDDGEISFTDHMKSSRGACVEYTTGAGSLTKGRRFAEGLTCVALIDKQEFDHPRRDAYVAFVPESCNSRINQVDVCTRPARPPPPPSTPPPPTTTPSPPTPESPKVVIPTSTPELVTFPCPTVELPVRTMVCGSGSKTSRPSTILFKYVGGQGLTQSQEGKASVSGGSSGGPATIHISNKKGGLNTVNVVEGGTFSVGSPNGGKLDAETIITIFSEQGTQVINVHTSCSKALYTADRFGGITVAGFDGQTPTSAVTVSADCSPVNTPCNPVRTDICGGGKGKGQHPSKIELKYIGGTGLTQNQDGKSSVAGGSPSGTATIVVSGKKSTGQSYTVPIDGTFTIGAFGGKIDAESTFSISSAGGSQTVEMHTSCSKALFVGDRFGALQVIGFNGQSYGSACDAGGSIAVASGSGTDFSVLGCCYQYYEGTAGIYSYSNYKDIRKNVCGAGPNIAFEAGSLCSAVRGRHLTGAGLSAVFTTGCCYSYAMGNNGASTYMNYHESTLNDCHVTKKDDNTGVTFEQGATCESVYDRHVVTTQVAGCCYNYKVSNAALHFYGHKDVSKNLCAEFQAGMTGAKFISGIKCIDLQKNHIDSQPQCSACEVSEYSRPTSFTFRYIGGNQLNNPQKGAASVRQDGNPVGDGAVITCSNMENSQQSSTYVSMHGTFTVGAGSSHIFGGAIVCTINTGAQKGVLVSERAHQQTITFSTACSFGANVMLGDVYGSLGVVGFTTVDTESGLQAASSEDLMQCPRVGQSLPPVPVVQPTISTPEPAATEVAGVPAVGCMPDICRSLDEGSQKLTSITFKVVLANRNVFNHGQDWKKIKEGVYTGNTSPMIRVSGKKIGFKEIVMDNHEFTIDAAENGLRVLPKLIMFLVGQRKTRTKIKFSLDCRKHKVSIGDTWGILQITAFKGNKGLVCTDFSVDATNPYHKAAATKVTGAPNKAAPAKVKESSDVSSTSSKGVSTGALVAIVAAVIAFLSMIVVAGVFQRKSRRDDALISEYASSEASGDLPVQRRTATLDELSRPAIDSDDASHHSSIQSTL